MLACCLRSNYARQHHWFIFIFCCMLLSYWFSWYWKCWCR